MDLQYMNMAKETPERLLHHAPTDSDVWLQIYCAVAARGEDADDSEAFADAGLASWKERFLNEDE